MKKYAFTFSGCQVFDEAVTGHGFLLRCMPGTYPFQRSYAHKPTLTPFAALTNISDVYGNEMYTGTIDKKHDRFSFTASGFVLCSKYLTHEPLDRLYLYPSSLTRPGPEMTRMASDDLLPENPWNRALALCGRIFQNLQHIESSQTRTAAEAFSAGRGDTRDFAQILLTLCRCSGIAARFVSGLAVGISKPHYWVEVYCDGVWRALDPSTGSAVEEGYLKISHGLDYGACALARDCFRSGDDVRLRDHTFSVEVTEHVTLTRDTVPHA